MNNEIKTIKLSECSEVGCEEKPHARGFCKNHYQEKIRYGEIEKIKGNKKKCLVKHCNLPTQARNLCHIHYGHYAKGRAVYDYGK